MGSTVIRLGECDPPAHSLTLVAAMALYETILPLLSDPSLLMLKWPNDLLLAGGKLSGILLEREGDAVILGIGVNLAAAPDLPDRPSSALSEHVPAPVRGAFAAALAASLAGELHRWREFGLEPMVRRWLVAAHPEGTVLSVSDGPGEPLTGKFAGLENDGSLKLRLADGSTRAIHAGDVMLG